MSYASLPEDELQQILAVIGRRPFSSSDFIEVLKEKLPSRWEKLAERYGPGGKGANKHYTANGAVGSALQHYSKAGLVTKVGFRSAPPGWGAPIIQCWTVDPSSLDETLYPESAVGLGEYFEGAKIQVIANRYERNLTARKQCIEHYGLSCRACGCDFKDLYGPHGEGFIHVHHVFPMSKVGSTYKIDPIKDLRPVCPNCHAMIHYKGATLTIDEVKELLKNAKSDL